MPSQICCCSEANSPIILTTVGAKEFHLNKTLWLLLASSDLSARQCQSNLELLSLRNIEVRSLSNRLVIRLKIDHVHMMETKRTTTFS
ncbi:unnamed protein product [Cylicocyclus nassatus]|uniref:Uncharacterized protein n=1 Tax=Cylicocyclus nassatus TaxID=53992 RepID=A0AA36MB36_CYLNA|nr:unnamed protein product [Cylicocyclus nassatus]